MPSTIHNVIQTFQVPRARERALSGTAERPEKHWAQFREITTKLADAEKCFLPERKRAPLTKETEISTAPSDHSKALQVYRKDSKVTSDWQEVLEPICAHKVTKLEKMLRDHSKMHPAQHAPPLTTIAVRWHSSGPESTYTHKDLCDIFSKVGSVTAVTFQSSRSAHVVFDSVNSACHAVFLKNLGHASCPLHTQWLPGAVYNLKWNKKQSLAKPFTPSALSTRFISPQAITRPSQICCRVCTTEIKQKR